MTNPGRPSLYRRDYCELASNYCLLGATNADLAAFFDVTARTIDNWIATHPEFAAAVHESKAMADARVARCLYQRAVGYERTVERTVLHQGRVHTVTNKVHLPPDTRACIFWLRNRQPRRWGGRPMPPQDDDVIDEIALLDAASEAARHAPSHHGARAPVLSGAEGSTSAHDHEADLEVCPPTSGRAAASVDDGIDDIALLEAASEERHHAPGEDDDAEPHRSASFGAGIHAPRSCRSEAREGRGVDTSAPARCRRQDGATDMYPICSRSPPPTHAGATSLRAADGGLRVR